MPDFINEKEFNGSRIVEQIKDGKVLWVVTRDNYGSFTLYKNKKKVLETKDYIDILLKINL
jgi:hypothetical protein